jgi:hypothetical protein
MAKRTYGIGKFGALILGVETPDSLADKVVGAYMAEAGMNLHSIWVPNYKSGIEKFVASDDRAEKAKQRLALWYDYLNTIGRPKLKEAYAKLRADYMQQLATLVKAPAAPAPTAAPARPTAPGTIPPR